jgi:hypothetical protein
MAQYLPPPPDGAASPGPSDYVYNHTGADGDTFYGAYYALIPYTTYADPTMNAFTSPDGTLPTGMSSLLTGSLSGETQFQQSMERPRSRHQQPRNVSIDQSPAGMQTAYNAVDAVRQLIQGHRDYNAIWELPFFKHRGHDGPHLVPRHDGAVRPASASTPTATTHWETQAEWESALLESYYESVVWHEFGHVMGLEHNFMGSVDKANWPTYKDSDRATTQFGKYSLQHHGVLARRRTTSSGTTVRRSHGHGAARRAGSPTTRAAIAFVVRQRPLGGDGRPEDGDPAAGQVVGASGQVSATAPWNDPLGWTGTTEKQFLFCSHEHITLYAPLPPVRPRLDAVGDHGGGHRGVRVELQLAQLPPVLQGLGRLAVRDQVVQHHHRHAPLHGACRCGTGARPS